MAENEKNVFYIKNMVCPRCITSVCDILEGLGLQVNGVELGRAIVDKEPQISIEKINKALQKRGFELLKSKNQQLIEQIKALLIRYLQQLEEHEETPKLSDYLSDH